MRPTWVRRWASAIGLTLLCVGIAVTLITRGASQGWAVEPGDAALTTILKGLEYHGSLLSSVEAHFTVEKFYGQEYRREVTAIGNGTLLPERGPGVAKYAWRSDGRRWLCEEIRLVPSGGCAAARYSTGAFDGEQYYSLDMASMMGTRGVSPTDLAAFGAHVFYFMLDRDGTPLSQFLSDGNAELLGKEEVGGEICYKVVWTDPKAADRTMSYWVAADRGFAVKRLEYRVVWPKAREQGIGSLITLAAQEWAEPAPGLWLPTCVKKESYTLMPGDRYGWRLTELFLVNDLAVNREMTARDFVVRFPVGVRVADEATGEIHMVGGDFDVGEVQTQAPPRLEFQDAWSE